jgi:hypothetical protein
VDLMRHVRRKAPFGTRLAGAASTPVLLPIIDILGSKIGLPQ